MIRSIFVVTLLSCCIALGQSPTVPAAPVAFEVAAIHPHQGPLHTIMGFSSSGPRLRLEGYNQMQLIMEAYNLKPYQVRQLVKSLQGEVLDDSEVLHVFTVKNGLIAGMELGDEVGAGPSAAFAHRS